MFKKLKEKITENSPQRLQQFTQSFSDRLQNTSTPTTTDENFFTISEDDTPNSSGLIDISLNDRRNSLSSIASDVSFLPKYESNTNLYHLQSDLDISEMEDNASTTSSTQIGHLTKEQIYAAFQKSQRSYHKYRGRYTDLARHYRELERENGKMKQILVETQDKAIRRMTELKEQCNLEQKAKAHLEGALRDELDEKQLKIQSLETKINLLQNGDDVGTSGKDDNLQQNDIINLTKYLNDARQEIELLNERIQEMKAHSIVYQSKEDNYKMKIASLERELQLYLENEKENNLKLAQNKMDLHNEIIMKDKEIGQLKHDIDHLKMNINENLQSQNNRLIEKIEIMNEKYKNYDNDLIQIERLEIELKTSEENRRKIESQLKITENQLENVREETKKTILNLEEKIRKEMEDKGILINDVGSTVKSEFEVMKMKLSESTEKIQQLTNQLIELENDQQKIIQEKIVLENNQKEWESSKMDYDKVRLENVETISNLTLELENSQKQLEIVNKQQHDLQIQLEESNNNIKTLSEKLEESQKVRLEQKELIKTFENRTENEIKTINTQKNELEKQLQTVLNENEILKQQIEENEKVRLENFEQISKLNTDLNNLQKQLEQTIENKNNLQKQLNEISTTNADLTKELEKVRLEQDELSNTNNNKNNLLEETVHKNEELQQIIEKIKSENTNTISNLKKQLKQKTINLNDIQAQLDESRDTNLSLTAKYEESQKVRLEQENLIETKINELQSKVALENELETKINEIQQLKLLIEKNETNYQELEKQLFEYKTKINDKDNEFLTVNDYKTNLEENYKRIVEENTKLNKQIDEQQKVRLNLEKQNGEQQSKLQLITQTNEQKMKDLKNELKKLQLHLKEYEDKSKLFDELLEKNSQLHEEISDLKRKNKEKSEKLENLEENKLELEKQLQEKVSELRLWEEKNEAIDLDKTETKLLEMKLQKMEEEKKTILDGFDYERKIMEDLIQHNSKLEQIQTNYNELETKYNQLLSKYNEQTELLDEIKSNENDRMTSQKRISQLEEQIRLWEEKDEAISLDETETKLLEMKIMQLESDKSNLLEEFENERKCFEEMLKDNSRLKESEFEVKRLAENIQSLHEIIDATNQNLQEKDGKYNELHDKCLKFEWELAEKSLLYEEKKKKIEQIELEMNELHRNLNESNRDKIRLEEETKNLNEKLEKFHEKNDEHLKFMEEKLKMEANLNESYRDVESLKERLVQYKSLDLTNRTSIEFYENELDKMRKQNEKLQRQLDETLVTLHHCTDLQTSTEIEYLKNVLYNYMMGKEGLVLARVIAAVCKFDEQQTDAIMQKEQQKQTLLGQLGII